MKKIGIIGYFGAPGRCSDGQSVKTQILADELIKLYGSDEVLTVNTCGGIKYMLFYIYSLIKFEIICRNVFILPAENSIRLFSPIMVMCNFLLRRKLHYVVIGGWLPEFLQSKKWLSRVLKRFDCIYVETITMKSKLEAKGFKNIVILPNCKDLPIVDKSQFQKTFLPPYKFCTLSRVNKKKGIEDAISAIMAINKESGKTICTLDIYGPIADDYKERFTELLKDSPNFIQYKGVVTFDKTVDVLKDYFVLLFPTHYFTEGIPGTVLDAYAAGVPVIFSRWVNYKDLLDDGIVGIGYDFDNYEAFVNVIRDVIKDSEKITKMKYNCIQKAHAFLTKNVIKDILVPYLK